MADNLQFTCHACGNLGFADGSDGFFYCLRCGSQAEDIIDTAVAEEDLFDNGGGGAIYSSIHSCRRPAAVIKAEPISQCPPLSQFWESFKALDSDSDVKKEDGLAGDGVGPTGPADFGSGSRHLNYEDYYSEIRLRYVMGVQIMIELQCKALVEEFQVSPLICGLAGTIWLRFVAFTRVFDDGWADEAIHDSESQEQEYSKDLPTYLQYCKDVVFAGLEPSFEDFEEEKIINELWDFYQERKDSGPSDDKEVGCGRGSHQKRSRDDVTSTVKEGKKIRDNRSASRLSTDIRASQADHCSQQSTGTGDFSPSDSDSLPSGQTSKETRKDRAIRRLKSNMEENRFCYIPPRAKVKRLAYLHYVRKKDEGAYTYAAHADYYILLRSCARVAQVDIRVMHAGVLSFERRLDWLEKRIDHCLSLSPQNDSCEFCGEEERKQNAAYDDSIDVSKLNL